MFISKVTTLATLFVAAGITVSGAGLWGYHTVAAEPADSQDSKAAAPTRVAQQADASERQAPAPAVEHGEELPPVVRVPSRREGIVQMIGTDIKEGEKVPAERMVTIKIGGELKKYRRLKKGDTVQEGQLLALLDDDLARAEVAIKSAKLTAAESERIAAEKTRDEALARYETQKKLYYNNPPSNPGAIRATSREDLTGALLTYNKYVEDATTREQAVEVAKQELNQARKILEMHEIRSPSRGLIKAIYKRPGEAVKALETVFVIQVPED